LAGILIVDDPAAMAPENGGRRAEAGSASREHRILSDRRRHRPETIGL
jgi:hypothetical protein